MQYLAIGEWVKAFLNRCSWSYLWSWEVGVQWLVSSLLNLSLFGFGNDLIFISHHYQNNNNMHVVHVHDMHVVHVHDMHVYITCM